MEQRLGKVPKGGKKKKTSGIKKEKDLKSKEEKKKGTEIKINDGTKVDRGPKRETSGQLAAVVAGDRMDFWKEQFQRCILVPPRG